MAKILICYFGPVETIYKSLAQSFSDMGHDVYRLNLFGYINFDKWGENYTLKQEKCLDVLDGLTFDFVLDFNHSLPQKIEKKLTCPICLWDADNPEHWWHKDDIKNNVNRYVFLGFKSCDKELYEAIFGREIKKYLYLPFSTAVQAQKMPVKHDISFIGSNFLDIAKLVNQCDIFNTINANFELFNFIYSKIYTNYFVTSDQVYEESQTSISKDLFDTYFYFMHWGIFPGCLRLSYLSCLSDFNLTIYGNDLWSSIGLVYPDLAYCFSHKKIITLEENQEIYNSSKISINISHPQAKDYFSWRVLDIMASNACLLTEDKKDFRDLFIPYLSQEVLNTIIFKDRFDMRQKVILLLNDEQLRLKCVRECQEAIKKIGRWKNKIEQLLNFLNIPLKSKHKKGENILLLPLADTLCEQNHILKSKKISKFKRYQKSLFYSCIVFLSFLPLFSFLLKKKRKKIIQKLITLQNRSAK